MMVQFCGSQGGLEMERGPYSYVCVIGEGVKMEQCMVYERVKQEDERENQ